MKPKLIIVLAVPVIFSLAGCVAAPLAPEASISHPANPAAAPSPLPAFTPGLMGAVPELETAPLTNSAAESRHQHDDGHAAHSRGEEKK